MFIGLRDHIRGRDGMEGKEREGRKYFDIINHDVGRYLEVNNTYL